MTINCTGAIGATGIITVANVAGGTILAGANLYYGLAPSWASPVDIGSITGMGTQVIQNGSGYVTGTYTNVAMTGGLGQGAKATIVVNGAGGVASVTFTAGGTNYSPYDSLSCSNASLGGSGSGFLTTTGKFAYTPLNITIDAYGTNGTTGVGGNGTYQTSQGNAAADPNLQSPASKWIIGGAAPPTTYSPPVPTESPIAGAAASSNTVPAVGTLAVMLPPVPLPETLVGSTTQTSFST